MCCCWLLDFEKQVTWIGCLDRERGVTCRVSKTREMSVLHFTINLKWFLWKEHFFSPKTYGIRVWTLWLYEFREDGRQPCVSKICIWHFYPEISTAPTQNYSFIDQMNEAHCTVIWWKRVPEQKEEDALSEAMHFVLGCKALCIILTILGLSAC